MGATFAIVGLVAAGILFALVTSVMRRRRGILGGGGGEDMCARVADVVRRSPRARHVHGADAGVVLVDVRVAGHGSWPSRRDGGAMVARADVRCIIVGAMPLVPEDRRSEADVPRWTSVLKRTRSATVQGRRRPTMRLYGCGEDGWRGGRPAVDGAERAGSVWLGQAARCQWECPTRCCAEGGWYTGVEQEFVLVLVLAEGVLRGRTPVWRRPRRHAMRFEGAMRAMWAAARRTASSEGERSSVVVRPRAEGEGRIPRERSATGWCDLLRVTLRAYGVAGGCGWPVFVWAALARRFDREIAEEAKRAPAPVFIDDEDYPGDYHSDPYAGPTAYADHSDAYTGPTAYSSDHPAHTDGGYPASEGLSSGVHSNGVHSNGVHSNPGGGGTPSNYMYPSGYSDLGFSDVSSHGTYSQPPMEGQYNPGAYAAYGGVGAGVGAAGAYEMMGYHNAQQQQQQQQHGQEWHPGHQQQEWVAQGYVYPGEEHSAGTTTSYPPTATTTNSSGSDVLLRSKSGARSLVDAYAPGAAPPHAEVPQPKQYADGYVSQYQARMQDGGGAYGGLESMHGHVGGLEDEETDGEGDGRRVLKVRLTLLTLDDERVLTGVQVANE
ncbi:hypothetical protein DFH09DRAFT_1087345 [Mycena vulgaris]|nr:hypothetical protein DFH09DRAFT_1087345 [Mycena vulgaris]